MTQELFAFVSGLVDTNFTSREFYSGTWKIQIIKEDKSNILFMIKENN
jgi:hypothetical protein